MDEEHDDDQGGVDSSRLFGRAWLRVRGSILMQHRIQGTICLGDGVRGVGRA